MTAALKNSYKTLTSIAFSAALAFTGTSAVAAQGSGASAQATASATIKNSAELTNGSFRYTKKNATYIVPQTTTTNCKATDVNDEKPCSMILTEIS